MNQHYRKLLKIFPTSCFTIFNQCRARRINSLDVNSPHSLFNLRKCLSKHQDWGHFRKILNTCEDCFLVFVFSLSLTTDHLQQQSQKCSAEESQTICNIQINKMCFWNLTLCLIIDSTSPHQIMKRENETLSLTTIWTR